MTELFDCLRNTMAERDRLREVNRELVETLGEAQAALNGAPNTIGLHNQIDAALKKVKEI